MSCLVVLPEGFRRVLHFAGNIYISSMLSSEREIIMEKSCLCAKQ